MKQPFSSEKDLINFAKQAHDAGMSYGQYQALKYANTITRKPLNVSAIKEDTDNTPVRKNNEVVTSHSKRFY